MTANKQPVASKTDTSTLVRPKFGPGMLLQHEDLEQLTGYTRELSRLMFRSLFGCGVICGLVVKVELKCGQLRVSIDPGLALECSGDPVYVPKVQQITIDEHCDKNITNDLWVVLCGTVKCCAPRASMCAPDDDEMPSICTRERDSFEIRVVSERPKCVCGCPEPKTEPHAEPGKEMHEMQRKSGETVDRYDCVDCSNPCHKHHYAGDCGCHCDDCSDCDCKCILLARLRIPHDKKPDWRVDHSVRRFIRPVLMRDPQVAKEKEREKEEGTVAEETKAAELEKKPKRRPPRSESENPSDA
ncbi:MAG TPA: hypothetical protein VFI05_07555 [Nitrospiraceae bacterium]|nr:hypothetical protein [Nitrospiraceae bacterium]